MSIPRKRNKEEKLFDFARFLEVANIWQLEEQFKNIWFSTYKIWVIISRFSRGNEDSTIRRKGGHNRRPRQPLKETRQYQEEKIMNTRIRRKDWFQGRESRLEISYSQTVQNNTRKRGNVTTFKEETKILKQTQRPTQRANEESYKRMTYLATNEDMI